MEKSFMNEDLKNQLVARWIAFARENLLVAQAIVNEDFTPFHTVCFMCHSAAEKFLKAFLLNKGRPIIKTHDLSNLIDECISIEPSLNELYEHCELLNNYAITGRYPEDLSIETILETDAKEAIESVIVISETLLRVGAFS
jgi:HEPN domain-containing protein